MDIHFILHALFGMVPLMYWCGFHFGRRSRDAEISALQMQCAAMKGLAVNNAAVADKVIAEIGKCLRQPG